MTAPAHTTRVTPPGIKLTDGFSSLFAFSADPDVNLWEVSIKPPGVDGGEPIETTTMHNVTYETSAPRSLQKLTPMTGKCAYDPGVWTQLKAMINVEQAITQHWPDGSKLSFYGFLKSLEYDELQRGTMPMGSFTIIPTCTDPSDGGEEDPVYVDVAGT